MHEFVADYGIISKAHVIVTGSVTASQGYFGTASWATNALSDSYSIFLTGSATASVFGTSSWATNALSDSYSTFLTGSATASVFGTASNSNFSISSSFSIDTISSSTVLATILFNTGSYNVTFISGSGYQTTYVDDQQAFTYDPGRDLLSVPNISASTTVIVPTPTLPQEAATKQYVDNNAQFGLDLYFRSASAALSSSYHSMLNINTPISSSSTTLVSTAASLNAVAFTFLSPALSLTDIDPGTITVTFNCYYTGGGTNSVGVTPEIWEWNSGVETFINSGSNQTLTKNDSTTTYVQPIVISGPVSLNVSSSLEVKFRITAYASGTPTMTVEGTGNNYGITVPIPSANFVQRSGDTMTGPLTASLYGTASVSLQVSS